MAAWAMTAALEQVLLMAIGVLGAIAIVGVVAVMVGSLVVRALLPAIDRHLDEEWSEVVAPLSTFSHEVPPTSLNQTAILLETIAAQMGFGLAPSVPPGRPHPSRDSSVEFSRVSDQLVDICAFEGSAVEDHSLYLAWREFHRTRIAELAGVVVGGEIPQWDHDLDRTPEGPASDLNGHMWLHRLLTAEAWLAAGEGDAAAAHRALEASWRLSQGLQQSPQLEVHEIALSAFELQTAVLRRIPRADHAWQDRLRLVDPPRHAKRAYLCRSWQLRRQAETMPPGRHPVLGFVLQPFARLLATQNHEVMMRAVSHLDSADITIFDSAPFAADQYSKVPRWNSFARSALMPSWDSWQRSVRSGLLAELTRRVLRVRELQLEGESSALQELQAVQPSRVSGLDWHYRVEDAAISIGLDPDPFSSGFSFPLSETVSLEDVQRDQG
jgi:hypothetical protein